MARAHNIPELKAKALKIDYASDEATGDNTGIRNISIAVSPRLLEEN